MEYMATLPDKAFDLAIVDPPYAAKNSKSGGTWAAKYGRKQERWDVAPEPEYFEELFRVSMNQIIWGGNYFQLPPTRCFIILDKLQPENFTMAMCEYAWTSFSSNAKMFSCKTCGKPNDKRIHPCQKPVALYKWILKNYAKPGDRILDTHLGSGTIAEACHELGFDLVGCEIDKDYYAAAKARLEDFQRQQLLFTGKDA
ncbi:MAG: site-specific DNA-methyltransferase [Kiritimatiellaeota bacterium]|nr:site-specific DNA-methyltransferase [Kiritimatiellota bacterium]